MRTEKYSVKPKIQSPVFVESQGTAFTGDMNIVATNIVSINYVLVAEWFSFHFLGNEWYIGKHDTLIWISVNTVFF